MMHEADTPGSTPRGYGRPNGAAIFTLSDDLEHHEGEALSPPEHHRPQAVFNLDMEYSDDDALLDWEQYAALKRVTLCGIDCTGLAKCLPCLPVTPPQWWYTYTRRQRRCMLVSGGILAALVALLLALLIVAAIRGTNTGSSSQVSGAGGPDLCNWHQFRLPTAVLPLVYNLTLELQMEEPYLVEGEVDIELNVTQAGLRCLVLHASDMKILDVRLGGPEGSKVDWRPDEEQEQLTLLLHEDLPSPAAVVHIVFQYSLSRGLSGFYRSTYTLDDGQEYSIATTQFEASSARTAFPCFDEPAMKAVFNVEVMCPPGLTVLFNMPPRAIHQHHDEVATYHFLPTPRMPTYLLAFVVGNLTGVSRSVPSTDSGAPPRNVTIWGTPDRVQSLAFAADTAASTLRTFERLFGVPYPLPKLDLVAIPDFAAGAMENWGLITYRETALLASSASSLRDYRYVSKVIAHEMTHQWFGNLVTMDFWGELWLNEGFASYWEFSGANAAQPEQDFFTTYYSSDVPTALYFDSKEASHPLAVTEGINSTDQVEGFFDPVMYEKGGAVLRMLRTWAAATQGAGANRPPSTFETKPRRPQQEPFLAGLQQYLQAHQYSTATSAQLWAALAGPLGVPDLEQRMAGWTYQQGYPLVQVSAEDGAVYLQQARFSLHDVSPCDTSTAWWVPVALATSAAPDKVEWTELKGCQSGQPVATLSGSGAWVKVNAGQTGYYRVQYDQQLWQALVAASSANSSSGAPLLSEADVAGLLEDSYALAEAGMLNITVFLDLLSALPSRGRKEYSGWQVALPYLYSIHQLVGCPAQWADYVGGSLLAPLLAPRSLGFPAANATNADPTPLFSFEEPVVKGKAVPWPTRVGEAGYRLLRPAALKAAGYFGNRDVKAQALNLMQGLSDAIPGAPAPLAPDDPARLSIDPDVQAAVYDTAAHSGDAEVYSQLVGLYLEARSPQEKARLLTAIAHAGPGGHVSASLKLALGPNVRSQDARFLVVNLAEQASSDSRLQVWRWLQDNWGPLHEKLGGDDDASRRMGQVMEDVASGFADLALLQEVDAMFEQHKAQQGEVTYAERAKESIRANAKWVERHSADVCSWVEQQPKGGRR